MQDPDLCCPGGGPQVVPLGTGSGRPPPQTLWQVGSPFSTQAGRGLVTLWCDLMVNGAVHRSLIKGALEMLYWFWHPLFLQRNRINLPSNRQTCKHRFANSSLFWHHSGGMGSRLTSGRQRHLPASARHSRPPCSEFTWTLHNHPPPPPSLS